MALIKSEKQYTRKTSLTKKAGRPKKAEAEKKKHSYSFKLTDSENKVFSDRMKQSGMEEMTAFLIHLTDYQTLPVQVVDVSLQNLLPLLNQVIQEINAIGVNINQVTKLVHQYALADKLHQPTLNQLLQEEAKLTLLKDKIEPIFYQIGQKWLSK